VDLPPGSQAIALTDEPMNTFPRCLLSKLKLKYKYGYLTLGPPKKEETVSVEHTVSHTCRGQSVRNWTESSSHHMQQSRKSSTARELLVASHSRCPHKAAGGKGMKKSSRIFDSSRQSSREAFPVRTRLSLQMKLSREV
jgi:hypothetical protein